MPVDGGGCCSCALAGANVLRTVMLLLMLTVVPRTVCTFTPFGEGELHTSRGGDHWLRGPVLGAKPLLCGAPPGCGEQYGPNSVALATAISSRILRCCVFPRVS